MYHMYIYTYEYVVHALGGLYHMRSPVSSFKLWYKQKSLQIGALYKHVPLQIHNVQVASRKKSKV